MTDGIINLLKPAGMTSHDAVSFLRRLTGEKHIGHTGTLDPMAVGVLPVCIGNATRIIEYLEFDRKCYRCELQLGVETDTQDVWGTVLQRRDAEARKVSREQLEEVLNGFLGDLEQRPPKYSAVRVNGRHLYEYARSGQDVEIKPRRVKIYSMELKSFDPDAGTGVFDVCCSKGTYIRSLCRDAGEQLGCGAAMCFLARTQSGVFSIEQTASLEELKEDWTRYLLPSDLPLERLGRIEIPEKRRGWYSNGGYLRKREAEVLREPKPADPAAVQKELYCVYSGGEFLGVSVYDPETSRFLADKIFRKRG